MCGKCRDACRDGIGRSTDMPSAAFDGSVAAPISSDDTAPRVGAARTGGWVAPTVPELGRFAEPALLILVSLSEGPKHGYAIMTDVEAATGRPIGPGTLYAALSRL